MAVVYNYYQPISFKRNGEIFVKNRNAMTLELFLPTLNVLSFPGLDLISLFSMIFYDRGNPVTFST